VVSLQLGGRDFQKFTEACAQVFETGNGHDANASALAGPLGQSISRAQGCERQVCRLSYVKQSAPLPGRCFAVPARIIEM
jgi:hypothetical protein